TPREMPVPLEGTVPAGEEGVTGGPSVGPTGADEAAEGLISGEDDQTRAPAPAARPATPAGAAPTARPATPAAGAPAAAAPRPSAAPALTTTTPPRAP
ncbi:MAG: hypothetical protein KBB95_29665, partial [Deltaproteobacteria bacterium]|nr:hypothetical protein [Deltaproteobacteria bacterium]